MEFLAGYEDESNTPTFDCSQGDSREKSSKPSPEVFRIRMDSHQSGSGSDGNPPRPVGGSIGNSDGDSSSSSDSSDENEIKKSRPATQKSSESSASSDSTSESDTERSDASKKSDHKELTLTGKDKILPKVGERRRSHSRSGSKSRRQRRSSDGRHRRSRSRDHHHKSSRSERKHNHRSRSRSRDRHVRPHDHRYRRDSHHHRRRRSSSRDVHRHRKSSPRRYHPSRSIEHRSHHREEKRKRSRSPLLGPKPEGATVSTSSNTAGTSRPPVYKVAGVKFSRGRGHSTGTFKDIVKGEYMQRLQKAEEVITGKSTLVPTAGPSQVTSSVATVSAGTGMMGPGGLNQLLVSQMQMHMQQTQQYLPGQPGCLTPLQKELNQKYILQSTGRTRLQVEAQFGVKIPDIYNENTNNLVELAERKMKRDRLWKNSEKKTAISSSFNAVPVLPGQSKGDNEKYLRLMGFKKGKTKEELEAEEEISKADVEQEALINTQIINDNLEREYESSRRHTHINRGCGLGYSTTMYQPH